MRGTNRWEGPRKTGGPELKEGLGSQVIFLDLVFTFKIPMIHRLRL